MAKVESVYDILDIEVREETDESEEVLKGTKPIYNIYQELISSGVTANLSFHGGVKLSAILNKVQQSILARGGVTEEEEEDEAVLAEIDSTVTEGEAAFLYGSYLLLAG